MGLRSPERRRPGGCARAPDGLLDHRWRGLPGRRCACSTSRPPRSSGPTTRWPTPRCGSCTTCCTTRRTRPASALAFRRDWESYRGYNTAFADALARGPRPGPEVRAMIQDYHLPLAPRMLRRAPPRRADRALLAHPVGTAGLLPAAARRGGPARCWTACWAPTTPGSCASAGPTLSSTAAPIPGRRGGPARRHGHVPGHATRSACTRWGWTRRAARPGRGSRRAGDRWRRCRDQGGDRQLIVRIDRTELSKNIVRGLAAYWELLVNRPERRGRVVHLAFAYPSRHDLPEYREYTPRCTGSPRRSTTSSPPRAGSL